MKKILVLLVFAVTQIVVKNAGSQTPAFHFGEGILKRPVRLACANGMVYVCDTGLSNVICFDTSGRLISKSDENTFASPTGIVSDRDGNLAVCDSKAGDIKLLDRNLKLISTLRFPEQAEILEPYDLCFDWTGTLNVLDRKGRCVHRIGLTGRYYGKYMSPGIGENKLSWPQSIASEGKQLAIADAGVGKIIYISDSFRELSRIGNPGSGPMAVRQPSDVSFDSLGNMFLTDTLMSDVNILLADGTGSISWGMHGGKGTSTNFFHSDTVKESQRQDGRNYFDEPMSVEVGNGCVYVADAGMGRIAFEQFEEVCKTPKDYILPFTQSPKDTPLIFANLTAVDFGNVKPSKTYTSKITVNVGTSIFFSGNARVFGNWFDVEPKAFIGTNVTFYITHRSPGIGENKGVLFIESNGHRLEIPLSASCQNSPGIRFEDSENTGFVRLGSNATSVVLNLSADKGIIEPIDFSCTKITYKTPWAKVAKGSEELNLSTVYCYFDKSSVEPSPSNTVRVGFSQTGYTRPGVYSVGIVASDRSGKSKTARWLTLVVLSNSFQKQSTILQEVFTAHWCEPCVLQREAGYRIYCEYGPRHFMPVAYHVMDDADLMTTGMTRPENYERFKVYGGSGVPQVANNGELMKLLTNSKQLAHDRISGRKYSGTTNDYYKMRGDIDSLNKLQDFQLIIWGGIDQNVGNAFIEIPGYDFENNTENELVVLLTEDDIEYGSTNGEDYHHFVVRLIATGHTKSIEKTKSFCRLTFDIPDMPEGFRIKPENSRLVAFVQRKDTKKVIACGWFKLNNPVNAEPAVFTSDRSPIASRGALVQMTFFVTNPSSRWKRLKVELSSDAGTTVSSDVKSLTIGSCATVPLSVKLDTTDTSSSAGMITIKVSLSDDHINDSTIEHVVQVVLK